MKNTTALLIIDAQTGIIEGPPAGPVYNKENLLGTLKEVLKNARNQDIPVIYVQDTDVGGEESLQFQVHPEIAPLAEELTFHKKATDSFHGTGLNKALQNLGIQHLVIMGCKTEYCIDTACRRATTLGFDVTLVRGGHSTTDNTVLKAGQIVAHHNEHLHGLSNLENFIMVRDSSDDLFEHKHSAYK
ncbi:cysteine hydrolase family protein [Peribacillus kribbensis]|uniref:cysteine hydrolase family protein n=1 Tax=Peribacillus kribbensis TaxID=356658 RepID=UPI00047D432E|nr:cysteine hydrolase family protein [Peribacillus kribbensis]